jgi:16S rRNA (guanine1207-N2)-methyltransferase
MVRSDRLSLAVEAQVLTIPADGRIVVLRAEPSPFLDLVPAERLQCVQTFRPAYEALLMQGRSVSTHAEGQASMVVLNVTRNRAETLGNVAAGLHLLAPGGTLVMSGAKSDGVDALARQIAACLTIAGTYIKAHGRVVWLARPLSLPKAVALWAAGVRPVRNAAGFVTAPGMFSPEHPDPGSVRLASLLPNRLFGRVADLGAGWGWLSHSALATCPDIERLDLHEAEALALQAARVNVTDPRAGFHWSDVTKLTPREPQYDAVISNPPFHRGRAAEQDLGRAFIAAAGRLLKPQGRLFLVANRQLPYEVTLEAAFRHWSNLGEEGGYKVLLAERPRRA